MHQQDLQVLFGYIKNIVLNQPITPQNFVRPTKELKDIEEGLLYISESIGDFSLFAQNISNGDFDANIPNRHNFLAGNLKELHAVLKHLTWQTKQVASGDYGQRVSFLGEFSESFNIMVEQLQDREHLLSQQAIDQTQLVNVFISILNAHMDWILVINKATGTVLYNNKLGEKAASKFEQQYEKTFQTPILQKHLEQTIAENKMTNLIYHYRETQNYYSINSYPMRWQNEEAIVHYIEDITEKQMEHETLSKIAYRDALTGAYNRHYCTNEIGKLLEEQVQFCIVMVDLNDLKTANDKYGHLVGDEYICTVVDILKQQTRDLDDVCRIGGDEFILLLKDCPLKVAEHKMDEIFEEVESIKRDYKLSISYGITDVHTWDWESPEELLNISDEKMYTFKQDYKQRLLDTSDGMTTMYCLYSTFQELKDQLAELNPKVKSLVQIFTANLREHDAMVLAREIQELLPQATIIGASANTIIFNGKQYDDRTSIIVEQYQHSTIYAGCIPLADKTPTQLVEELKAQYPDTLPQLIRVLISDHYNDTYDFINAYKELLPNIAIAGGLASGQGDFLAQPFLFNTQEVFHRALSFIGIVGERIHHFTQINTSTIPVTSSYTITETNGSEIVSIDGKPATTWFHDHLGFDHTIKYKNFDDAILNDPFMRFPIVLENNANRVLYYNHETKAISQYFTKLPANTTFQIGYASPSQCVVECKNLCNQLQREPVEFLFAYSCLVRRLSLYNCSTWELAPYKNANVCGVFLLSEFGYEHNIPNVFNSSYVLVGLAESNTLLTLNMSVFTELGRIESQHKDLIHFLESKHTNTKSLKVQQLLDNIINSEKQGQKSLYFDSSLNMPNVVKYEKDNSEFNFTKLCLIKIINAELLMGYMGHSAYLAQFKTLSSSLYASFVKKRKLSVLLHFYGLHYDTIIIAADERMNANEFLSYMSELELHFKSIQYDLGIHPFITRFVMVSDHPQLLAHAYRQLQLHYSSQDHFVIGSDEQDHNQVTKQEIEIIQIVNHAITHKKVIPYYQGIFNNETCEIDTYEAFMRIEDSSGNLLAPIFFLETAKKYSLYTSLTKIMLELVLHDFADFDSTVSINVSSLDITSREIREFLKEQVHQFPNPSNLIFEILEDECFDSAEHLEEFVLILRSHGAKIAVDDFGSGYSNLLELIKIKPDFIKIDGQIIKDIPHNKNYEIIISTIASMAKQLDIDLIAEFVENLEVQDMVNSLNIEYSQGYFFSEPKPFAQIRQQHD